MNILSQNTAFGGMQGVFSHLSETTGTEMTFAVFVPPQAIAEKRPVLWYLSGLTCSHANVMEKGEYRVSLDTLFKILGEFDLGIGEFFGEDPTANTTADDVTLLRQVRSLPEEDQREIEEFVGFKRSRHLASESKPSRRNA